MENSVPLVIILQRESSDKIRLIKSLFNFFFGDSLRIESHWINETTSSQNILQDEISYFHIYERDDDINILAEAFGGNSPIIPLIWSPTDHLPANVLYMRGPIYLYWAMDNSMSIRERIEKMLKVLATTISVNVPSEEILDIYIRQLNKNTANCMPKF